MVTGLQQVVQYIRWAYPAMLLIVTQPLAIMATVWLTSIVCKRRFDKWMFIYGPTELRKRIVDLQLRCAERGRENARLTARNAAILASMRAATTAQAHAMQALGGVPELYEGGTDE